MTVGHDEATTIEVRGIELNVDMDYLNSWEAFKLIRKLDDDQCSQFDKLDYSFEFIQRVTGCDESQIVEYAGGEKAPATEVIAFTVEIIQKLQPLKN